MKPKEIVIWVGIIVFVLIVSLIIGGKGVRHNDRSNQKVASATAIVTSNRKNNVSDTSTAFKKNILHSFTNGKDGAEPSELIQGSDGNFYGTTTGGMGNDYGLGTIFKITPQGQETVLYNFAGGNDGARPYAGLIQASDHNFYGTTQNGGVGGCKSFFGDGCGTVFKITPQGQETVLYYFAGGTDDGKNPEAGLIQGSDGNFYGTTTLGGGTGCRRNEGCGTVYKLTQQGQETILYSFAGGNDGSLPSALIQGSDGNFYGTTRGDDVNSGTVFKITPQGQETVLYSFTGGTDGANPQAGLIQGSDDNLYGTTSEGGSGSCKYSKCGTIFKITPQGQETVLHNFAGGNDGEDPRTGLIQGRNGNFYGTTFHGGGSGCYGGGNGTVFTITPQGVETTLYRFTGNDGECTFAGLIQASDGNFYGTTEGDGNGRCDYGCGTVFKLTPQ